MDIKKTLFELSSAYGAVGVNSASKRAYEILSKYCECEKSDNNLTVIGRMSGKSDYTLMLDAHIDEVSAVVTNVDDNGFVTVDKAGGIDIRTLPARPVIIHGKKDVKAVFCSTPPHLAQKETEYTDISKIKLDTMLGGKAKDVISAGDVVTYCTEPKSLLANKVTGKSFDDRAGVVCLLEIAERLSKRELPINVVFVLSDAEELGLRGAKMSTFKVMPDEAVAIDVSFGDGPDIPPDECGKLSHGAMIGISPVLDIAISKKLTDIAENNKIKYQTEVMGKSTGTNSDVISVTKTGVKTGLLSIPLRNMHTDAEIIDLDDLISVCDILEKYILSGGIANV